MHRNVINNRDVRFFSLINGETVGEKIMINEVEKVDIIHAREKISYSNK
jgi:hypothetical protein